MGPTRDPFADRHPSAADRSDDAPDRDPAAALGNPVELQAAAVAEPDPVESGEPVADQNAPPRDRLVSRLAAQVDAAAVVAAEPRVARLADAGDHSDHISIAPDASCHE